MKSTFTDQIFSSNFNKAYARIKNDRIGQIFIENEIDKDFWTKFIGKDICSRFNFSVARGPGQLDDLSRGKSRFKDHYSNASESVIFAVDADFDIFLSNKSDICNELKVNPYIIHSIGYSKESLTNSYVCLNSCLSKYFYFQENPYKFDYFLSKYSIKIYPFLLKYLYLLDIESTTIGHADFHKMIIPRDLINPFFDDKWDLFDKSLEILNQRLDINEDDKFKEFIKNTNELGLNENNSYQFIDGHDLEDRMIKPIVDEIKRRLISKEIETVKASGFNGTDLGNKINEIRNYFKEKINFLSLRNCAEYWLDDNLYKNHKKVISTY